MSSFLNHLKPQRWAQDVRFWKDRLLYQIRRFRQIVGRSLDQGQQAFDEIPDAVEKDEPMEQGLGLTGLDWA